MPVLRLFAAAREAAGVARADLDGATVGAILEQAEDRYGERFSGVLAHSRVWVNGQPAQADTAVQGHDVIAVLPPVSGGSDVDQVWGTKSMVVDPVPTEAPAAVVLLERQGDALAVDVELVSDPEPVPPEPDRPESFPGWPTEPTIAYQPAWPEDPPPEEMVFGDITIDEPDWLAPDDPGPRPIPPQAQAAGYDQGWSGWSTTSGNYEPITYPAPLPPPADAMGTAAAFFASATPPPAPPFPVSPDQAPARPAEAGPPAEILDALDAQLVHETKETEDSPPSSVAKGGLRRVFNRLAVVHDTKGPHGRLGLLWAVVTVGAAIGGAEPLAGWLGITAFVGACQASGARLGKGHRVLTAVSAVTAVALPAAALLGVEAVAAAVGGAAVLAVVAAVFFSRGSATHDGALTFAIGTALGLAAVAPVLLRPDYIEASFLLLAYAATYDAGAYLVGTGASSVWEGPVAGVAALIPVVIISAVLLVPPFDPGSPIALGVLAAVLAPLGPLVGSALVGGAEAHAPGLRRLDSLIVLGPIWAVAAVAFIS